MKPIDYYGSVGFSLCHRAPQLSGTIEERRVAAPKPQRNRNEPSCFKLPAHYRPTSDFNETVRWVDFKEPQLTLGRERLNREQHP